MLLARVLTAESLLEWELGLARLGELAGSGAARARGVAHATLLLTGLSEVAHRFLRVACDSGEDGPRYLTGDLRASSVAGLLSGGLAQLQGVLEASRTDPELGPLTRALAAALEPRRRPTLVLGDRTLRLDERAHVMGILNVTPDSFSDGGRLATVEAAVAHGLALAEAGADVLDVGGVSTRPGARPVPLALELERVIPVIRALRAATDVPLSVDTTAAEVARVALAEGAAMVNDVSGLRFDPAMPWIIASARATCCLMHLRGTPETMQRAPRYADVVEEVLEGLEDSALRASSAGVDRARIVVDPGIGFGKTPGHNALLLRRLPDLRLLGQPVLVGTSRKSFIGHFTARTEPEARLPGTLASLALAAVSRGADLVRVHDVREARDALRLAEAVRDAREAGTLYVEEAARGDGRGAP